VRSAPRYPVYVISKGRSDCCKTARFLQKDGVPFRLVVEPQEADAYASVFGADCLEVLPFSNLGLGSIPARNWCWEHAKATGHERHWILDDNIRYIERRHENIRIRVDSHSAFQVTEDFTDRYENIAILALNYHMFAPNGAKLPPFQINHRCYSFLLIRNDLPQRWRGRYNEDTDLTLQVLSSGWCTVLFNLFVVEKATTLTMKGGNTTELYLGDGRLKMARSLERMWPGVVTVSRRYGRPQHVVNWKKFDTPLKLKAGIDLSALPANEYGMHLVQVKPEVKSAALRALLTQDATRRAGTAHDSQAGLR
jgi:hypothetical protein